MSLVSVLVAVGLAGALAMILSRMSANAIRANRSTELRGDLESIRNTLRNVASCSQTLPADLSTCDESKYIPIRRKDGTILVKADGAAGSPIGSWYLRASCDGLHLNIEAARKKSRDGAFLVDPLTQTELSWRQLFTSPLCSSGSFGALRVESADKVVPTHCGSKHLEVFCGPADGFDWTEEITFAKPFRSVPRVMVSVHSSQWPSPSGIPHFYADHYMSPDDCMGGMARATYAYAGSVTKSGFTMSCNALPAVTCGNAGSRAIAGPNYPDPKNAGYGDLGNYRARIHCSWTAIGDD
jgi:hypothetical protein